MNITVQALIILTIILPGLIMIGIFESFTNRKKSPDLERVILSIAFSMIFYWLQDLFGYELNSDPQSFSKFVSQIFSTPVLSQITGVLTVIVVPFSFGYVYEKDIYHSIFRRIGISTKTSKNSAWLEIIGGVDSSKQQVRVITTEGDSYVGNIRVFSGDSSDKAFSLTFVYYEGRLDGKGMLNAEPVLMSVKEIAFFEIKNIKHIEILNPYNQENENGK